MEPTALSEPGTAPDISVAHHVAPLIYMVPRSDAPHALVSRAATFPRRVMSDRRGAAALEFALVVLPYFTIIIFLFVLCLHFYFQEMLDIGLHTAVRQIQTGNAQNVADGGSFITSYLCPAMNNQADCTNLYINVRTVSFASGQDYYNITSGTLPMSGGALDLSAYGSANFCNAAAGQFVLITAIYVAPSIMGTLLPNVFSVSLFGSQVDAVMSQVATYTEDFPAKQSSGPSAPSC